MAYRGLRTLVLLIVVPLSAGCTRKRPAATVAVPDNRGTIVSSAASDSAQRAAADARAQAERDRAERERRAMALRERLETRIYFNLDRSDLTAQSRAVLDEKVQILQSVPESRIRVIGHADERGSDEYNLALGQRRAAAARRYLAQHGIDASRIEIASLGEEEPVCSESTEACWSRNRRDDFHVTTWAPLASRR